MSTHWGSMMVPPQTWVVPYWRLTCHGHLLMDVSVPSMMRPEILCPQPAGREVAEGLSTGRGGGREEHPCLASRWAQKPFLGGTSEAPLATPSPEAPTLEMGGSSQVALGVGTVQAPCSFSPGRPPWRSWPSESPGPPTSLLTCAAEGNILPGMAPGASGETKAEKVWHGREAQEPGPPLGVREPGARDPPWLVGAGRGDQPCLPSWEVLVGRNILALEHQRSSVQAKHPALSSCHTPHREADEDWTVSLPPSPAQQRPGSPPPQSLPPHLLRLCWMVLCGFAAVRLSPEKDRGTYSVWEALRGGGGRSRTPWSPGKERELGELRAPGWSSNWR